MNMELIYGDPSDFIVSAAVALLAAVMILFIQPRKEIEQ